MSTSIDIHRVTHVQVLDQSSGGISSTTRTIIIKTKNGTHDMTITVYGSDSNVPVMIGECEDE